MFKTAQKNCLSLQFSFFWDSSAGNVYFFHFFALFQVVSQKLAAMFENLPKTYGQRIFSTPTQSLDHHRDHFTIQRKRIAHKLKNPRLLRITFKTLRHFKGTMEYHKTKDIIHVMQTLGHRTSRTPSYTYIWQKNSSKTSKNTCQR